MSSSSIYGSAAAPITITGLSSGIDSSSIIAALSKQEAGAETKLQNEQTTLNSQLTAWQTFNTTLLGLQSIASSLSTPTAFNTTQAVIDQSTVASVTAQAGAVVGTHTLTVTGLAQSQKVTSTTFTDPTVPLNISGSFVLNGKTISVSSSDTLNSLATSINSASAGVQASVISAGTGKYQISLSAGKTGTINSISASDFGGGTALETLGFLPSTGATQGLRQSITTTSGNGGAGSIAFANSSQPLATLLGATNGTAPSGNVTIGGTTVSLNLNTMSLTDVANAINGANITGVQAQIVGIPDANGTVSASSQKQLQIVSTNGTPLTASSFTDNGGVLSSLGIVQTGFSSQTTASKDAGFSLDGVTYSRSSNTVNDAISNVSINLLATNNSSTSTPANITVSADNSAITGTINNFVTAYNGVVDAINAQMTYSGSTKSGAGDTSNSTPPLFGDFTLQNIQSQLSSMLNVTNGTTSLASIGITVNQTGDLSVDSTKLQTALSTSPQEVSGLFATVGSATGSGLSYVAAGSSTQSSGAGYAVNVSQAASQGVATALGAFQTLTQPEKLTFTGGLFGSASAAITLSTGTTLQNAIDAINGNANVNQFLYASQNSSGNLVLTSKGYGSNQLFFVSSDQSGSGTTGIGASAILAQGKDVQGTINGEAATGNGTSLIGKPGNKTTAGLQITYSGTTIGNVGSVAVHSGLAAQFNTMLTSATDSSTGTITTAENSINTQVSTLQTQITEMQAQVTTYEQQLTTEFANMETAMSTLKSQQAAFNAEAGITPTTSSSGSTTPTPSVSTGTSTTGA